MNDKQKEIFETFDCFLKQFEKYDEITQIVLEEFFKELLSEKK
jgi:hypothetical protein